MVSVQYYDVIFKPMVIGKNVNVMADEKYTFLVHTKISKIQIKEAVEKMFPETRVTSTHTTNLDGKTERGDMILDKTSKTKEAIVQLTEDSKEIEVLSGL